ncbi:MAG: EscE/YscE/SsaE family type III secretion system needle protein co-chaperone [Puniceicoccales bacterium]|jgi:hypothetical protein|nr:EscE/YscE/SsaE family type III secretion system needle protein co-chaperone [Puniceicoccales bacterium]
MEWGNKLMEKEERITLSEMERRLLGDGDERYRAEILEQLARHQRWVMERMGCGLPPQMYNIFNKLKRALESAKYTITNFK